MDEQQISVLIDKAMDGAVKVIEERLTMEFRNNILTSIYMRKPSKYYERTEQMLKLRIHGEYNVLKKAVILRIGNFDVLKPKKAEYDFLHRKQNKRWFFNSHMSVYGEDDHMFIPLWWNQGTENKRFPSLPKTHIWDNLNEGSLPAIHAKILENEFAKQIQLLTR